MEETFGQRLSRIRKEKGLTQEDIAKKIVISPQAVSKWENDLSSPDILMLSSIADILGVSIDELLGHQTNNKDNKEEKETVESEVVDDEDKFKDDGINFKGNIHIDEESININNGGVHIKDGDSEVHIDATGVHIRDGEKNVDLSKEDIANKFHKDDKTFWITQSSLFGLALIGFVLMGLLWTDQGMGWVTGWILFLMPPVIMSVVDAIRKRRFCLFLYPVAVTAAYCLLGFLGNYLGFEGWGFYWFLFITIPAYYMIFGPIDSHIHRQ